MPELTWRHHLCDIIELLQDECRTYPIDPECFKQNEPDDIFKLIASCMSFEIGPAAPLGLNELILDRIRPYSEKAPEGWREIPVLLSAQFEKLSRLVYAAMEGMKAEYEIGFRNGSPPIAKAFTELKILHRCLEIVTRQNRGFLWLPNTIAQYRDGFNAAIDAAPKMGDQTPARGRTFSRKHPANTERKILKRGKIDLIKAHIIGACGGHWDGTAVAYLAKLEKERGVKIPEPTLSHWRDEDRSLDRLFSASAPAYTDTWTTPESDDE